MELTQEGLKELLRRDEETGKFYWKVDSRGNGLGHKVGDVAGTIHNGYVVIHIGGIDYGAHCLTWLYVYGVCPKEKVDHIDGDPSNNRTDNLREATHAENGRNRKLNSSNTSGHRGVHFRYGRWGAAIRFNRKLINLGYFDKKEEAVLAYETKSEELFGKFKRTLD